MTSSEEAVCDGSDVDASAPLKQRRIRNKLHFLPCLGQLLLHEHLPEKSIPSFWVANLLQYFIDRNLYNFQFDLLSQPKTTMMSSATLQSSRLVRYMATAARRQGMSPTIAMRAFSSDEAAPAPAPAAPAPAASTSTGESSSSSSPAPAPESDRIHSTEWVINSIV